MLQLLEAISYVHERKIAHLDIKVSFYIKEKFALKWCTSIDQKWIDFRKQTVGVFIVCGLGLQRAARFALA